MRKILCILFVVILTLNLVGCAKIINTETEVVEATIIDIDYDPMWIQPIYTGKTTTMITHPADYDIYIKYEDIETEFDIDSTTYDKYQDLVGKTIEVNLVTYYYDNDTTTYFLELIEE